MTIINEVRMEVDGIISVWIHDPDEDRRSVRRASMFTIKEDGARCPDGCFICTRSKELIVLKSEPPW